MSGTQTHPAVGFPSFVASAGRLSRVENQFDSLTGKVAEVAIRALRIENRLGILPR